MKFPVTVRHRTGKVKIYAPAKRFSYYRICFTAAGKRQMQTFASYSEAREAAEKKAKEIHSNSIGAGLTATQAQDAFAAYEKLNGLYQSTGIKYSLLGAVSEFAEAKTLLHGRSLTEVGENFLKNSAVVKPHPISKAVEEFLDARHYKSEVKQDGKREQMSPIYASNVRTWLNDFADTFPGTMVSQRKDTRLVAKGVAGGYLRIFEAKHPLSWAKRLIARHETNEEPTGGAFLRPESRCANRNFENGSSAVVKTERRRMAMK